MAGKASVVFNADTGQYIVGIQQMDSATLKVSETVATAKNKILDSYKAQEAELKKLGGSTEDYATAYKNATNALTNITEKNADQQVAAYDRVLAKQRQTKAEMKALGDAPKTEGAHGFSDRMATSAVVRAGEGTASIRATENFLTMIPGATAAAQGLAVAIGAGGVLGIVYELGEKGYESFHKLETAMKDAERGADELHAKSQIMVDDKEIENQKIQDQIAKLSGKPNNGLALALLEAKKNADQLAESLKEDRSQMEALFKQQDRGFGEKALHELFNVGPEDTKQQRKELLQGQDDLERQIGSARETYSEAITNAKTDADREAARKAYTESVHRDIQARIDSLKKEYGRLDQEQKASERAAIDSAEAGTGVASNAKDNSLKKQNIQTNIGVLQDRMHIETLDDSIYDGQKKLGGLKQTKDESELARKAAETQRQKWESQLAEMQQSNPDWKAANTNVFYRSIDSASVLPGNKVDLQKKIAESGVEAYRQGMEQMKRAQEEADRAERQGWSDQLAALKSAGYMTAQAEADYWTLAALQAENGSQNQLEAEKKANEALARLREERERAADARSRASVQGVNDGARVAESTVALEQQTGQISKYDAAVQLANIHTQQYAAQQAALKAELEKQTDKDPDSAGTVQAREAVDKAAADRTIQIQQDAAKIAAESWKTALQEANAQWVQNSTDSARQVKELYSEVVGGFNEQAATAITGGKTDWSGYVRGIGKTVAKDGLEKGESAVMGALGLGKPDGSSSNPLWVRMAEGGADSSQGATSALGGLLKMFGKGGTDGGDGGDSGDTGAAVSSIADSALGGFTQAVSMGGFALGGDIAPSPQARSMTVGEMGEEQITLGPGTAAHVTPNKDLGGNAGNVYYSVQVANGVTPEEVQMRVHQAIAAYHPQAMRSSVQAVNDAQRRKPSTAR